MIIQSGNVNSYNCSAKAPTVNSGNNNNIPKECTVNSGKNYLLMILVLIHPPLLVVIKSQKCLILMI